jgi:hypothetical protein
MVFFRFCVTCDKEFTPTGKWNIKCQSCINKTHVAYVNKCKARAKKEVEDGRRNTTSGTEGEHKTSQKHKRLQLGNQTTRDKLGQIRDIK